jgi:hypothetical protein
MSVYLKKFGQDVLEASIETVRIMGKNHGNGGNQYKSWKTNFLGEVLIKLKGRFEINEEWNEDPLIKILVNLKTYKGLDEIRQNKITVVPVSSGLEKPGAMKTEEELFLLENPGDIRGQTIGSIEADTGIFYLTNALRGAASVAMWKKLNLILTQKHDEVDNRFWHDNDYNDEFPSCSNCVNKCYVQPAEGPVSGDAFKPSNRCAMTGETLDDGASESGNWLATRDHGLLHGLKGHMYLNGEKRVTGGGTYSDNAFFSVKTGGKHTDMSELREADFAYHADKCPFYAPHRVIPERAIWRRDLNRVYLPNIIVNFK